MGSHSALAVIKHAVACQLDCTIFLFKQSKTSAVIATYQEMQAAARKGNEAGLHIVIKPNASYIQCFRAIYNLTPETYIVHPGASSWLSTLSYINAAFELEDDILLRNSLGRPDFCFVGAAVVVRIWDYSLASLFWKARRGW